MNEINLISIKNIEAIPMSGRKGYEKAGRTRKGATQRKEGDGAIYVKNEIPVPWMLLMYNDGLG